MEHMKLIDSIYRELLSYQTKVLNEKIGRQTEYAEEIVLTTIESDILYFLGCGKSYREIAKHVGLLRETTICDLTVGFIIINQLYPKFAVSTKSQLIEKATLLKLIPFLHENYI